MASKRKRARSAYGQFTANGFGPESDPELLVQAEELAASRERTSVPGRAAVNRALRDILEGRRKRVASAEALAALGEDAHVPADDEGGGAELDDWSFPDE